MPELSPFELNVAEQPDALRVLAASRLDPTVAEIATRPWNRIVLTGMGSSHFAGIPTWRRLVARGRPAWSTDASSLLDAPGLITPRTLVIATSQSGASGEVVELLQRSRDRRVQWGALIGIAADVDSPLANAADAFLPLHCGTEATVSSKSYLNTLAVHRTLTAVVLHEDPGAIGPEITRAAAAIQQYLTLDTEPLAHAALSPARPRLVTIGWGDEAATALYAALIIKESSKVAVEGFVGGAFRHGPFELAGPDLTAVIFASSADKSQPAARIASDLVATGAQVLVVGDLEVVVGATKLVTPTGDRLEAIAAQSVVAQSLAVALSRANGVVPGQFNYGSKVTSAT